MLTGPVAVPLLTFWRRAWKRRESLVLTPEGLELLAIRHAEAVARLFERSEREGTARERIDRLRVDAALAVEDRDRPGPRTRDGGPTRQALTRALRVVLAPESLREPLRPDLRAALGEGGRPIPAAEWVTTLAALRRQREHECSLSALSPDPAVVLRDVNGPWPILRLALLLALLALAVLHWSGS